MVLLSLVPILLSLVLFLIKFFPNIVDFRFGHWTKADWIVLGERVVAKCNILRIRIVIIKSTAIPPWQQWSVVAAETVLSTRCLPRILIPSQ